MKSLRAAIIGCGPCNASRGGVNSIAYAHARALVPLAGVELVAAASRNPKNVSDFCGEFPGVQGYTDYREMLQKEKPEWVSICAFPPDREEMAMAALESGCEVLVVEKPFAVSMGAARRILALAETKNARVYVDHQRRYGRCFEWFQDQVAGGEYGAVRQVNLQHPGKGFINFGPHLVDTCLLAFEGRQPVAVQAAVDWSDPAVYQGVKTEKNIVATAFFDDKSRLTIESGDRFTQPCLQAVCENGLVELYLSPHDATGSICRAVGGGRPQQSPVFGEHFHHNDSDMNLFYDRAFPDMLDCFRTGKPCRIDAAYALTGLEIILGLYESARQGQRIALPLPDGVSLNSSSQH